MNMLDKIIEIAKKCCSEEIEYGRDTSIMTDMEFSSLEFFQFVSRIEEGFNVHLTERELNRIDTLGDLEEILKSK